MISQVVPVGERVFQGVGSMGSGKLRKAAMYAMAFLRKGRFNAALTTTCVPQATQDDLNMHVGNCVYRSVSCASGAAACNTVADPRTALLIHAQSSGCMSTSEYPCVAVVGIVGSKSGPSA